MATLGYVANRTMDMVYQGLAPRDKFFEKEHFMFHCAAAYSKLLDDMYQALRKENKVQDGFSNVEMSPDWLISENLKVQKTEYDGEFFVQTSQNIFGFSFNAYGNGLNGVRKSAFYKDCNACPADLNFRKISIDEIKFYKGMPYTTDCYYYVEGNNKIYFVNRDPVQVKVFYVPTLIETDENCHFNDALVDPVVERVFNLFISGKAGVVIQKADDGNRNTVLPQQVNTQLNKA
jgi:hypothetical protein